MVQNQLNMMADLSCAYVDKFIAAHERSDWFEAKFWQMMQAGTATDYRALLARAKSLGLCGLIGYANRIARAPSARAEAPGPLTHSLTDPLTPSP